MEFYLFIVGFHPTSRLVTLVLRVTYMSEQRLLSQSTDQAFGVHMAQPQDVQRTTIYSNNKGNIYTSFHALYILGRLRGASIRNRRAEEAILEVA